MTVLEPHDRIVTNKLAHFATTVVRATISPGSFAPPVIIEVDSAQIVFTPAVELPDMEVARPEVVVHNVQDHGDSQLMSLLDELLERPRAAIGTFNGENVGRIVPPRKIPGKFGSRHDFDCVHTDCSQMPELLSGVGQGTGSASFYIVESSDVELIDDELIPRRHDKLIVIPRERRVVDDAVSDRVGDFARVRVDSRQLT